MPRIKVRSTERTFSSQAGLMHWLPGSLLALRPHPTMWEVWNVGDRFPKKVGSLLLRNLVSGWDFTLINDWKRGEIIIRLQFGRDLHQWSISPAGSSRKSLIIQLQRTCAPVQFIWRTKKDQSLILEAKEILYLDELSIKKQTECEKCRELHRRDYRIYLGCHKAAHWPRIDKRCDLAELGPIFSFAGQWATKILDPLPQSQSDSAQKALETAGLKRGDMQLTQAFERFWRTHFNCCGFPHWGDFERTGLEPIWQESISPIYLYTLLANWLLNRLLKEGGEKLIFLPSLPALFHSGRVENLNCLYGSCDFNWSKKELKEVTFRCFKSAELSMIFQKTRCLRIRRTDRRHGATYALDRQSELRLFVQSGKTYQIDQLSDYR